MDKPNVKKEAEAVVRIYAESNSIEAKWAVTMARYVIKLLGEEEVGQGYETRKMKAK